MRQAFSQTLAELAQTDPRILLLTADLGYLALEPFADAHPQRFFNMGVAEQNMVGVATGLAEAGFIPFTYSIVTFSVLRPYEFIRNGPIGQHLPVRIVSVGGGVEYGHNGISHFGLEDIAVMRAQPGITLVCPCDADQARTAIRATWDMPHPIYLRLSKDDKTRVPGLDGRFEFDRAQKIHEGDDALMIALGTGAVEAARAAELLAARGIGCTVLAVSTLNPAPTGDLLAHLARFRFVMTVETHYTTGGLGSLVSEMVAENSIACRVIRCGIKESPGAMTGSQAWLHRVNGLDAESLAVTATAALSEKSAR
ncbi:MAG: transketolase [Chthoniobacter sp.]|jgi:transketolase|nr:transketolase [Chthoniobacter sp.]